MTPEDAMKLVPCNGIWCHPGTPCACRDNIVSAVAEAYEDAARVAEADRAQCETQDCLACDALQSVAAAIRALKDK